MHCKKWMIPIVLLCVGCIFRSKSTLLSREQAPILLNFAGKASSAGWDIGVAQALVDHGTLNRFSSIWYSGNSSGALLAAFFSCFGLNNETLRVITEAGENSRSVVPDDPNTKVKQLFFGHRTESGSNEMRAIITNLLTKADGSLCLPSAPLILNAVNGDVLDSRVPKEGFTAQVLGPSVTRSGDKIDVDISSYDYTVRATMTKGADKVCTYFANAAAIAEIQKVDLHLCDIRPIASGRDLVFAVMASISEPTIFFPVREIDTADDELYASDSFHSTFTDPFWNQTEAYRDYFRKADLLPGMAEKMPEDAVVEDEVLQAVQFKKFQSRLKERTYIGGFLVSTSAPELTRANPNLRVLSTGRPDFDARVVKVLKNWFAVDVNQSYIRNRWWSDVEIQPTAEQWTVIVNRSTTLKEAIELGFKQTVACIASDGCAPVDTVEPSIGLRTDNKGCLVIMGKGMKHIRDVADSSCILPSR